MILAGAKGWIAARRGVWRAALAFLLGAALALGHAPYDFPYLWIIAFPALVVLISGGSRFWTAWLTGLGYFGLSLTWIVEPFLVDVARHGWMAPFALVFLAGGLALFWGCAGWAATVAMARGIPAPVAFPVFLAIAEAIRARIFTGFPWAHPAYVWIETPIAQLAAWVGPHGLGLLVMMALGALAARDRRVLAAGVAGLLVLISIGAIRGGELAKGDPGAPVVRIAQPNAPQHLKWRPDMVQVFYERLLEQSAAPPDRPLSMIIWPETAVPFLLHERPDLQADISTAAGGVPVVMGLRRHEAGWRNSLAVIGAGGEVLASYDKHHLVPFGEYVPLRGVAHALGLGDVVDGLAGSFEKGPGQALVSVEGLPSFQPLICYEVIFPHKIGGAGRPDLLLQITNDAWFGQFSGPYQHLAQARMRAIEQGLPLVRSANTGVSAMIDAKGRIMKSVPLGETGFVDVAIPNPMRSTPYSRYGDLIFVLLLAGAIALAFACRRRA